MLSFSFAACHSRQEPKPVEWKKGALTTAQAAQKLKDAERQQPCSQENRKKATEEQKHRCDPTRGMFDNVKPVAPSAIPNHQKSKRP
jgi:hypothetical protein